MGNIASEYICKSFWKQDETNPEIWKKKEKEKRNIQLFSQPCCTMVKPTTTIVITVYTVHAGLPEHYLIYNSCRHKMSSHQNNKLKDLRQLAWKMLTLILNSVKAQVMGQAMKTVKNTDADAVQWCRGRRL